jgi:hypothetical protein
MTPRRGASCGKVIHQAIAPMGAMAAELSVVIPVDLLPM